MTFDPTLAFCSIHPVVDISLLDVAVAFAIMTFEHEQTDKEGSGWCWRNLQNAFHSCIFSNEAENKQQMHSEHVGFVSPS